MACSWGVGYIIDKNWIKIRIHGRNTKREVVYHGITLKMTVIIRSLRWAFVFVALFLLLEVHATGAEEKIVDDTTVSVLARPLLTLY